MVTRKKQEEKLEIEVRNKVVLEWLDDDGNPHKFDIRLRRPKGKVARQAMPKVLSFLTEIGDHQEQLEKSQDQNLTSQTAMIALFEKHEELFPFILQIQGNKEAMRIYELELVTIELMEPVFAAAQYIVSESLNRPEVQEALKKSGGEEVKEEPEKAT